MNDPDYENEPAFCEWCGKKITNAVVGDFYPDDFILCDRCEDERYEREQDDRDFYYWEDEDE